MAGADPHRDPRRRPRWRPAVPARTIARDLNVSTRTVQTHVSHALAKLGLASRIELAAAARARPDPPPR
nr:LuxR C-terminal-related transcriptional regulator [Streptomyces sp. DconLS]